MNKTEIRRIVIEAIAFSRVMTNIDEIIEAVIKEEAVNAPEHVKDSFDDEYERINNDHDAFKSQWKKEKDAKNKMKLIADSIILRGGFIDDANPVRLIKTAGAVVVLKNCEVSLWINNGSSLRRAYISDDGIVHLSNNYDAVVGGTIFSTANTIPSATDILEYNDSTISDWQLLDWRKFSLNFIEQ